MFRIHIVPLLGVVAVWLTTPVCAQDESHAVDPLIRVFSPGLRQMDERLKEIESEMEVLPEVMEQPWGSRYGHRSADLPDETTPDWLQLDLGERRRLDMVALMPANLSYLGEPGAGYGFPKRFRVEISDHPDMREAVILVDESKSDVTNPGKYPLVYELSPTHGRYLRFTSLKHAEDEGIFFWAMEELMVMEGVLNVAASMDANMKFTSNTDLFPQWVTLRIIDGQSTLGMPVDVTTPSPTQGYLSDKLSMEEAQDPLPDEVKKWCAVDLGDRQIIERVLLLPLESEAYEVVGGRGYPRSMTIQLAHDPKFDEVVWEARRGGFSLGYPAGCAINIVVPEIEARYVRVLVDRMWSRDDAFSFGLSEIQVYDSDRNLALGKRVYVKDQADKPADEGWAPEYLVDGYTSRYRLIEWPEYLPLMHLRGQLEREKAVLMGRRDAKLTLGRQTVGIVGVLCALLLVTGWVWGMVRHRVIRRRESERLRQQIARDLHDDIGSNLGGIVLLSEIGSKHSTDEGSKSDFIAIHRAAEEASLSMRDIVWLIQRERVGLKDFVTRMRQSMRMILSHLDVSFEVAPEVFRDRSLGLLFRRHAFLAFKEVLNNVRKHAQTDQVAVKVEIDAECLRFIVRDEGVGFDPEMTDASGQGMDNLKRRAARLSGSVRIDSASGQGTKVTFVAPFSK